MKKYQLTGILFGLIAAWSAVFGMYKYYFWGYFQSIEGGARVTLESIAGDLSLGAIVAFLLGSLIFSIYKERIILIALSILTILLVGGFILFGNSSTLLFSGITILFGAIYAFWSIVRNILISMEIERTGLKDTLVNGVSNILFIVLLIAGSILGGVCIEKYGVGGSISIILLLIIIGVLGVFSSFSPKLPLPDFKTQIQELKQHINHSPKKLIAAMNMFMPIMFPAALLLVIATLVSQKSIDYSVTVLGIIQSKATMILLYSAVGSILGNILTMKVSGKFRWNAYTITLGLFAVLLGFAPYFFESFVKMSIFAFLAGLLFGAAYNFVESYFFVTIAKHNQKTDGAVAYGILCSVVMACMMYLIDVTFPILSYQGTFISISIGLLILTIFTTIHSREWK